jgi:hypothetical protein
MKLITSAELENNLTHEEWNFLVGFRGEKFEKLLLQVAEQLLRRWA